MSAITKINRRAAIQSATAIGALALPAGAALAAVDSTDPITVPTGPSPRLLTLYRAWRRAWAARNRASDEYFRCEYAARRGAPEAFPADIFETPVMEFIRLYGLDAAPDHLNSGSEHYRLAAAHIAEHRDEIVDALERHGWFAARERYERLSEREATTYRALMEAPASCPADMLVKLKVRVPEPDSGDMDEQLFAALHRDLRALAGRAGA
jgi:hypothetical protein